jgi:hypothetical protein
MSRMPLDRNATSCLHGVQRVGYARTRVPVACFALACLLLVGCPARNHAPADAAALARPQAPLDWHVDHARVTHRLVSASQESRDAMPGHQFVVLDVSVRNRDVQPQVLSEGKLIALDETQLQTFDQPETMLSDDYLSLQVLAPQEGLHGKIAYEVPEPLSGVLYWSPGNGSERILLNPVAAPASTLADAGDVDTGNVDAGAATGDGAADARIKPVDDTHDDARRIASAKPARVLDGARKPVPEPARRVAAAQQAPSPAIAVDTPDDTVDAPPVADAVPVLPPTRVPVPAPQAARIALSPPTGMAAAVSTRPDVATPPNDTRELARRQACESLVARDDPADKAGKLDFFATSCRDYALPVHWRPQPARRSLLARARERATSLLARVLVAPRVERISACDANASHADRLVCADPDLSAMEHRLAQSFARASDHVDPVALQNEQERWRGRVRDACGTTRCLQQAYGRRIAQLDALAPMRP